MDWDEIFKAEDSIYAELLKFGFERMQNIARKQNKLKKEIKTFS